MYSLLQPSRHENPPSPPPPSPPQAYGMENVRYEDYPVFLSYPIKRELTITAPFNRKLEMKEAAYPEDPYSSDARVSDLFLAYSPSGSVQAEVVFANYGRTEDFETLAKLGVSCRGKIVIVRYGEIYRGDKVGVGGWGMGGRKF